MERSGVDATVGVVVLQLEGCRKGEGHVQIAGLDAITVLEALRQVGWSACVVDDEFDR